MIKQITLGLALVLAMTACSQPTVTTPPITDPVVLPTVDISKLVGTWKGNWKGQDGLLAAQSGTLQLIVASDGKTTCTLTNSNPQENVSPITTSCSGSVLGNTAAPNSGKLTAQYQFTGNSVVTATGVAHFLPKNSSESRAEDVISGILNNVAGATNDPQQFTGDIGNLYFLLKKS